MKVAFRGSNGSPYEVLPRFAPISRLVRGMAGVLMVLLFQGSGEVQGENSLKSYKVKLAWNASASSDVTGYLIHYGTVSGTYAGSFAVGNVTSAKVPGLTEGLTYYFVVSAVNADGLRSQFSNEVDFTTGLHTSRIRTTPNGKPVVKVAGLIGREYDIEASVDLKTWIPIETFTMPDGGSLEFSDPDAARHPKRFYRTRQRP